MGQSCLVGAITRYMRLTDHELRLLHDADEESFALSAGQSVVTQGSPLASIYVLTEGWAVVRSQPVRGRSSIIRIKLPGEILGLSELAFPVAPHTVQMQTDGRVCGISRDELMRIMQAAPRLSAALAGIASIEQISLRDQCAALGLMPAEDRLIQFFLELQGRLGADTVEGASARILVPFSQAEIGEAVGMTPVYVNKLLRKLSIEGRIVVDRPYVTLNNFRTMQAQIGFTNRHRQVDQSWFPEAA